jgi:hypothetical protein
MKLYKPDEAAAFLRMSRRQLLEETRKGRITVVRKNARVFLYEEEALEEYVEKLRVIA